MKLISHGAAREVTGTCHELQVEVSPGSIRRVLLDCGLFQGRRQESAEKNAQFAFKPAEIDAVILSHAHGDHTGRIPLLWKRGYRKKILCTYATKDLAAVMMADSGYVQEKDEEFFRKHLAKSMIKSDGPLYTQKDAEESAALLEGKNYNEWFQVVDGVRCMLIEAGHILGAAMLVLEITELGKKRMIGFSADLGRSNLPIIRDPAKMPDVEVLICESTYGNRRHEEIEVAKTKLQEMIAKTAARGGKILIPAFSLERTQEIVYDLHLLWDSRQIPPIPIVIDSPLASRVTEIFQRHPECYDKELYDDFLSRAHNPFQFSLVRYTSSVDESKAINGTKGPMVIMAGSGMCEAGRIRHHLANEIEDVRNCVVAVGYMAKDTLGARIIDPTVHEVKIFDEHYQKKAEIHYIDAYSGHGDMDDLDAFVAGIGGLKKVFLVHGEIDQMEPFAARIREKKGVEVLMPQREEVIIL